jgi:uncharacterized membrane protein
LQIAEETKMTAERPLETSVSSMGTRNRVRARPTTPSLTRFLGWFSLGLGAAELVAPRTVARISGTKKNCGLIRMYGLREMVAGVGILTRRDPAPWLWMRVGGDLLDLASLVAGGRKGKGLATAGSVAAVAGVTALDVACAQRATAERADAPRGVRAEANVLIARSPEECYRFWRELRNISRFSIANVSVRETGERTAHASIQLPGGHEYEWDVETVEDEPPQRISWRHLPGGLIEASGSVTFEAAPGGRGTLVRVQVDYDHPAAAAIAPLARFIGKHPDQLLYKSLRRMKQLLEVGEIITTEGQPAGRRASTTWLDGIAQ